ncbi:MAG: hypothetical protein ABSD46_02410 [Bacteroidota bacterium]
MLKIITAIILFFYAICNAQDSISIQTESTLPFKFIPNDSTSFGVNIDSCKISYDTISGIVKVSGVLLERVTKERLREFHVAIGLDKSSGKKYVFKVIDSTKTDYDGHFCLSLKPQEAEHMIFRYGSPGSILTSYSRLNKIISELKDNSVAPNQALKLME